MAIKKEKILEILNERKEVNDIKRELSTTKSEVKEIKRILMELENEDRIERIKDGKKIYYQLVGSGDKIDIIEPLKLPKLKKLELADFLFILILSFVFILNFNLISQFEQLPSPMYGGDYYYHLGQMNHYDRGGSIFEHSAYLNETQWAPFLYMESIVYFSKITGLDIIHSNLYFSLLILVLSAILIYIFSIYLFKDKLISLIPVVFFCFGFPVFKYSIFDQLLIIPFFLFTLLIAIEKNKFIYYFIAGITYGLVGITHTMGFMVCSIFLVVLISYLYLFRYFKIEGEITKKISFDKNLIFKNLKENYRNMLVFLGIGIAISLLYWYQPIFIHHLQTPNDMASYQQDYVGMSGLSYMLDGFKTMFFPFNFSSLSSFQEIIGLFITILFDLGLIYLLIKKRREFKHTYLLLILAGVLIATYHYVFTIPIIGKDFFSSLMLPFLLVTLKPLLLCYGLIMISEKLDLGNTKKYLYVIIILLLLIFNFSVFQDINEKERWTQVGKQEMPPYLLEMSNWVKSNTGVRDVFISTNEHSFMFNGLTGNKVMNSRRSHSGMYVDVDRRWADSAVILYGNNSKLRSELIKKYNVKYIYWQYDWITMDYRFDQSGKMVGWFDPFLIRDINNYSEYLS
ncbi:MAG: hypothetical protein CVT90_02475, partial [Candidatus Altiarchaeales archaeon HGW-Altiarchaeales-3]